jgi:uncharacterized damage-inducible protein DinB
MFRKIEDFEESFKQARGATMRILGAMSDETLGQTVAEGHRDLARMAWHIVLTYPEMMKRAGLKMTAVAEDAPVPTTLAEILTGYKGVTDEFIAQLKENWDDDTLLIVDEMFGEKWARGLSLSILLDHEVHHRGQMTVLMRQAGLTVPGVFGPAKEEWKDLWDKYGLKEPPV